MMNKYNQSRAIPGPSVTQKCANPDCTNKVTRKASEQVKGTHLYCSMTCGNIGRQKDRKYTPENIAFVVSNINKILRQDLEKHLNCKTGALKSFLIRLRKLGYPVPHLTHGGHKSKLLVESGLKPKVEDKNDKRHKKITSQDQHMKNKPLVGEATRQRPEDKKFPTRKIVTENVLHFNIGKTHFTARDEAHKERIIKQYSKILQPNYLR